MLMDVQMPVMGGIETTRRMRLHWSNLHWSKRVPVIGLTAYTASDVHAACIAAGMDAIATKPVHGDALTTLLARHLAAAEATELAAAQTQGGGAAAKSAEEAAAKAVRLAADKN